MYTVIFFERDCNRLNIHRNLNFQAATLLWESLTPDVVDYKSLHRGGTIIEKVENFSIQCPPAATIGA